MYTRATEISIDVLVKNRERLSSEFRTDINGLRAWAVVAVILYHFGIPGFNGGFVGVDVFFVISGLLMTGIVIRGLERGNFSLLGFYMARARRILPALVALCAVLLLLGWFFLLPADYKALGGHSAFSVSFLSNMKFWLEAGYFDAASHEKWLIHTWSLAVEWQFYLLLPVMLLAFWKRRGDRGAIAAALTIGMLASLALSFLLTPLWPSASFFLLHTRAWEMLAGGLVFLLAPKLSLTPRQKSTLEMAGLFLIIGSVFVFDASSAWPGWRALFPVVGTVTILLAARIGSLSTGNALAQWLGTRSYSLYLWHWPIVVALSYFEWRGFPWAVGAGLVLTLVLGNLSYWLVETPARIRITNLNRAQGAATLTAALLLVMVTGMAARTMQGFPGRFPIEIEKIASESTNLKPRHDECFTKSGVVSKSCMYGGARLKAILIGDSHADAVTTGLAAAVADPRDGIMDWSYMNCPTLRGVKNGPGYSAGEQCGQFMEWAVEKLKTVPGDVPLVIVNRASVYALGHNEPWENDINVPGVYFSKPSATSSVPFLKEFAHHLTATACELAKERTVYLMRPIPEMGVDVPKAMSRAMLRGQSREVAISLTDYHKRHAVVWAAQNVARDSCGVKILDPLPYLCRDRYCYGTKNNQPLYYDDDHLSEYGNRLLVPMFASIFGVKEFRGARPVGIAP